MGWKLVLETEAGRVRGMDDDDAKAVEEWVDRPEVPLLTGEALAVWKEAAVRLKHGSALWRGLPWLLMGVSYRQAAERVGCHWMTLWKAIRDLGLLDAVKRARPDRIAQRVDDVAELAAEHLLERLEDPEQVRVMSTKEIGVLGRVYTEHHATRQGWGKEAARESGMTAVLDRIADQVARGEAKLTLTLEPSSPDSRAIDVTAEEQPLDQ